MRFARRDLWVKFERILAEFLTCAKFTFKFNKHERSKLRSNLINCKFERKNASQDLQDETTRRQKDKRKYFEMIFVVAT
ncbi:hypothetical protein [uncultured Campylobacter sp.]|uniref:hypothetical protein n=1 Tax=uncultured Campylobacter sp. TaxID=218934 RepID=UPI0028E5933E|nr:hypothetical protein [uncultured Campylobacter sp.]